ncbi:HAD family hydrolase [Streptomyces dangxiongensis]|uniref:HAD family hydrolase n=1 Tax=Streptomyces dangxiongensis TaxID=1442032 RepID=A0A3G2JDA7_9ACTN|nr:HAD-IA family hydrolase [Streptomyces dangxiongensis]AYN40323.1 HAD family hydrolase [Streptomyces dangxiongensis]
MSGARPVRTVVLDLDGVLIDSIHVMRKAFQRAYELVVGAGQAPFEEYLRHLGRHMPDTLAIMGLPATMYEPFVIESRKLVHEIPACPGAADLLRALRRAGVPTAVATGKTHSRAVEALAATGLLELLDAVCGSDEVAHGKPAPDIVLLALDKLGAGPDGAVMVGDSALDLEAGRRAGVGTAAGLWGQGGRQELLAHTPDLVAGSCTELRELLLAGREGAA